MNGFTIVKNGRAQPVIEFNLSNYFIILFRAGPEARDQIIFGDKINSSPGVYKATRKFFTEERMIFQSAVISYHEDVSFSNLSFTTTLYRIALKPYIGQLIDNRRNAGVPANGGLKQANVSVKLR